jgi:hypothetical protein
MMEGDLAGPGWELEPMQGPRAPDPLSLHLPSSIPSLPLPPDIGPHHRQHPLILPPQMEEQPDPHTPAGRPPSSRSPPALASILRGTCGCVRERECMCGCVRTAQASLEEGEGSRAGHVGVHCALQAAGHARDREVDLAPHAGEPPIHHLLNGQTLTSCLPTHLPPAASHAHVPLLWPYMDS